MTAKTETLSTAMAQAFAEIEGAKKDASNPHFKAKFATLGSVMDAIKPALARHGLWFEQHTEPSEGGVIVETFVGHSAGEWRSFGKLFVPANKNDAQGYGSALTYARRYGLMTAFGVPAEDDDGNAAAQSYKPTEERKAKLNGTYDTLLKLETATKAFAHTLQGIDDLGELIGWLETPEVKDLQAQGMRDLPAWWDTGEGLPEQFIPMTERIHLKKRALEERETLHPREQNVLEAG